jgi:hypothetical protein
MEKMDLAVLARSVKRNTDKLVEGRDLQLAEGLT